MNTLKRLLCVAFVLLNRGDQTTAATTTTTKTQIPSIAEDEPYVSYEGFQAVRVENPSDDVKDELFTFQTNGAVRIWSHVLRANGSDMTVMVNAKTKHELKEYLKFKRASFEVTVDDLQKAIDEERKSVAKDEDDSRGGLLQLSWDKFHSLSTINKFLDALASAHPSKYATLSAGTTQRGRHIKYLKAKSKDANARNVVMIAGTHPDEWLSVAALCSVVASASTGSDQFSSDFDQFNWFLIPVLNPDGYEYTRKSDRHWRKNRPRTNTHERTRANPNACEGVDLDRNFGFGFAPEPMRQCNDKYPGPKAFSEEETKAVKELFEGMGDIVAFLSVHSGGRYVLYPWSSDASAPVVDASALHAVGARMAAAMKAASGQEHRVGSMASVFGDIHGTSVDWFRAALNVTYPFMIQLGGAPPSTPPNVIASVGGELKAAVGEIMSTIINSGGGERTSVLDAKVF